MPLNTEPTNHHPDDNSSIGSAWSLWNRIFPTRYNPVGQHPDDSSSVGSRWSLFSRLIPNPLRLVIQQPDDNSSMGSNDRLSYVATSIRSLAISMYEDDENTVSEGQIPQAAGGVDDVLNQSSRSQSMPASELPMATTPSNDEPASTNDEPEDMAITSTNEELEDLIIEKVDPNSNKFFYQTDVKMSMSEADEFINSKISLKRKLHSFINSKLSLLKRKLHSFIKDQMEPPTKDLLLEDFETMNRLVHRKYHYLPGLASFFHGAALLCLYFNTLPWYFTLTTLGVIVVLTSRVFALKRDITSLKKAYRLCRTIFNKRLFHHLLAILANLTLFIAEALVAYSHPRCHSLCHPIAYKAGEYGFILICMAILVTVTFDCMIYSKAEEKRSLCKSNESRLFLEIYMPRNFICQIAYPLFTCGSSLSAIFVVLLMKGDLDGNAYSLENLIPHVAMFSMWFPAFLPVV